MNRILVLDDDHEFRAIMKDCLNRYGFDIQEANTCSAAHDRLDHEMFDLFICSSVLADRTGVDVCKSIRFGDRSYAGIAILMLVPEEPIEDEFRLFQRLDITVMNKYRSPEQWREKILGIGLRKESL